MAFGTKYTISNKIFSKCQLKYGNGYKYGIREERFVKHSNGTLKSMQRLNNLIISEDSPKLHGYNTIL